MKDVKEEKIVKLFKNMVKEKTSESELAFFKQIYETNLFVPMNISEGKNESTTFSVLMTKEGKRFIPAFLRIEAEIGEFETKQLKNISYIDLKHVIIDSGDFIEGIAINPFTENIVLNKNLIEIIDSKMLGMTINKEYHIGKIQLYEAKNVSETMIAKIREVLESNIGVQEAWIVFAKGEKEKQGHLMVIIDFIGSKIELFPKIAEAMKMHVKQGERFELIQRNEEMNTDNFDSAKIYSRRINSKIC